MSFPTPTQAEEVSDLSAAQYKVIRDSFGIIDDPLRADRTYVIFDAAAGNNNFHIDTGASLSYEIIQGDGSQEIQYTDTGGIKILNFTTAGRFLITVKGTFQGLDTNGVSAAEKEKYISIIAGSNYPVTIPTNAFKDCTNLEFVNFSSVITINISAFYGCGVLNGVIFPALVTINDNAFRDCILIEIIDFPKSTTINNSAFKGCSGLKMAIIPKVITIDLSAFENCTLLRTIEIIYNVGLTVSFAAINAVILDVLYVRVATLSQAQGVRTKFKGGGAAFSSEFKLISNNIQSNDLSISERINEIISDYLGGSKTKYEDIGSWDMDAVSSVNVAHGLADHKKIRSAYAMITNDADTIFIPLMSVDVATGVVGGGVNTIGATNITIVRRTGGPFDGTGYNDGGINRGYLKINYVT